eukprot:TRINITY_DN9170_c0_g1_i2.p1 TRINITY_DN9170_c0_g1~~TRINITY_DN9170_c0_g1_i2.p1  ORF type:complete len:264 (-),score=62.63 TRINITY_DN9170_c0_g1_i2:159-920(-)
MASAASSDDQQIQGGLGVTTKPKDSARDVTAAKEVAKPLNDPGEDVNSQSVDSGKVVTAGQEAEPSKLQGEDVSSQSVDSGKVVTAGQEAEPSNLPGEDVNSQSMDSGKDATAAQETEPLILPGYEAKTHVYSDLEVPKFDEAATVVCSDVSDRTWRRGYYQARRWDLKAPEIEEEDGIGKAFRRAIDLGLEPLEELTPFERATGARTRKLQQRRDRYHRQLTAASPGDVSSSGSSSSAGASGSSIESGSDSD